MQSLARRVVRFMRRHALVETGDRVAVAVSGGPDSVALLWLLTDLQTVRRLGFAVAGLIHVNHGLRGAEAERDEAFCRALAARLNYPIEVGRFDVAARARARRTSIEVAGRDVRYEYFAEAAARLGATKVATGHTLDDQAETVLLRLFRGAGRRGVSAVRARRGLYVRPVLDCRRRELREYLDARDEAFCADSSNDDLSIPRNGIRRELVPVIERLAPGAVKALARFAAFSGEDEDYLAGRAIELASGIVLMNEATEDSGAIRLDARGLAGAPAPLARRAVRVAAERVMPAITLSSRHLEAVRALAAADKQSGRLDLPGLVVRRRAGSLTIERTPIDKTSAGAGRAARTDERSLPVPGAVTVPEAGVTITAEAAVGLARASGRGDTAVVQARAVTLPLAVRTRRIGDRMRPLGAPGRRKLQDVFVDRKVPRAERDRVPLVVDAAGRIVWVVGLTIAHDCRVTAPESGVVVLKVER